MAAGFKIIRMDTRQQLAFIADGAAMQVDLAALSLAMPIDLGVIRVDSFDVESTPATVQIDEAEGLNQVIQADYINVVASPAASGTINVRIELRRLGSRITTPFRGQQFEVAVTEDLGDVLTTLDYDGQALVLNAAIGPFTHGAEITAAVRARDGDIISDWAYSQPVMADAMGPRTAILIGGQ